MPKIHFERLAVSNPEIMTLMEANGFSLSYLQPQGPFEGQTIEMEAYFFKKERSSWRDHVMFQFWARTLNLQVPPSLAKFVVENSPDWKLSNRYVSNDQIQLVKKLKEFDLM